MTRHPKLAPRADTLWVQYGLCSIAVQACDELMIRHLERVIHVLPPWVETRRQVANCALMVVSPETNGIGESRWRAVAEAWAEARFETMELDSKVLDTWRTLYRFGELISQGIFLFQDRARGQNDFFCLVPPEALQDRWVCARRIIKAVEAVAIRWHTMHGGGGPLHACGIERREQGYLFLGPPEAGKTTVAGLSEQAQATIVHDDQVMVGFDSGHYLLSHPESHVTPVLRAIFLLRKADADRLITLTPQAICAGLAEALLEYAIRQSTFGPWVRQAFHNVAVMARNVPGYVLYFRKSPEFWDVIDAELGR